MAQACEAPISQPPLDTDTEDSDNADTKDDNSEPDENLQKFEQIYIKQEIVDEKFYDCDFYHFLDHNKEKGENLTDNEANCDNNGTDSDDDDIVEDTPKDEIDNNCIKDNKISTNCDKQQSKPLNLSLVSHHTCPICKKSFTRKSNLVNHLKVHTGIFDFPCTVCDKGFTCRDGLVRHMKSHNKSFKCSMCTKRFSDKRYLRIHLKLHDGIKDYQCEICKKSYTRKFRLESHMKLHNGVREFKCEVCSKAFIRKDNLARHMKIH